MVVNTSGKRKEAIAKATVKEGDGKIRVNSKPLKIIEPEEARLKMKEPLELAKETTEKVNIDIDVEGGGYMGQADAVRTAIARGLVEWTGDAELRDRFEEFDRTLLLNDPRRKEEKKAGGRGARARRQKSYR